MSKAEMTLSPECLIISSNLHRKENDPNGSPKKMEQRKKSEFKGLRLRFTSSTEKEGTKATTDDLILSFVTPKHCQNEPHTAK
jgi:hypothetical protein